MESTSYPRTHNRSNKTQDNIYDGRNINRIDNKVMKKGHDRFEKSKSPERTGIIPPSYNKILDYEKRKTSWKVLIMILFFQKMDQ
jgi:hypothetical protein